MKFLFCLFVLTFCVSVWTSPIISINDANVPTAKYSLDALSALQQAYEMYPVDENKRIQSFVELFSLQHSITHGWNVAEGCTYLYRSFENYIYVTLNVVDDNSTSVIKIFN